MFGVSLEDCENFDSLNQEVKVDFISLFAPRLKIERKRLGLSQAEAAQVCGVSREIWGKYERAMAVPGGDVIFAFASAGADIHFVKIGRAHV